MLLTVPAAHAAATTSSSQGLTTAEATIIAAACTAVAVLTVGILNVLTQRKQLIKQEQQSNEQLAEQRKLLEHQIEAQRQQSSEQLEAQRDQFTLQLAEQRDLQRNERAAEAGKIIREEKKSTYTKMLAGCREIQAMWQLMADQHPQSLLANLNSAMARLEAEREAVRIGLAEIELLGSDNAIRLVTLFTDRTAVLLATFVNTSEAAIQRSGQPTLDTLAEAQRALREEIRRSEVPRIYSEMREIMRREILGDQPETDPA